MSFVSYNFFIIQALRYGVKIELNVDECQAPNIVMRDLRGMGNLGNTLNSSENGLTLNLTTPEKGEIK